MARLAKLLFCFLLWPALGFAQSAPGTINARLLDGVGNRLASSTTTPAGNEQALIVRNIPSGTQPVTFGGNSSVFSNQQAVTATAAALPSNPTKGVCVKALVANTLNVYVGASGVTTSTGAELAAGDSLCLPVTNSNLIFVIASSTGSSVSFIGTN